MSHTNPTFAYIEDEARHEESDIRMGDRPPIRMPVCVRNGGFHPTPIATLTPEQARAAGWELYNAIVHLDQVLAERGQLTDAVIVNVWGGARVAVRRASKVEAVAASDSVNTTTESDAAAGVGETTAVDATGNPSSPRA
jgi:hypothetical protein